MTTLTDENVIAIRRLAADGVPQVELAKIYGVSRQHIHDIVKMRRRTERRVAFDEARG